MIESTGEEYLSSPWAKAMFCAGAKAGKTAFLIANALGVMPNQKGGGVVDRPESLHVISFDANALGGVKRFLIESCGAPTEALRFNVYNMQEDARAVSVSKQAYDQTFFNTIMTTLETIRERTQKGVPVLHISSLTGLAAALERAISGPPEKKGGGMDIAKWSAFAQQLNEIRNYCQPEQWHCFWEAHVHKPKTLAQGPDAAPAKETLQIDGKTGQNFPYNVEQIFRLTRSYGDRWEGTNVDKTYLDTQAHFDFVVGGRNFTESLAPKEYDVTYAFSKLGLRIGQWGKKAVVKPVKKGA